MIGGVARFVGAFVAVATVLVVGILLGVNAVDKGIQRVEAAPTRASAGWPLPASMATGWS